MKHLPLLLFFAVLASGQESDMVIKIKGGTTRAIAIPDFRAAGPAQPWMETFNSTLFTEIQESGFFEMAAKSFYPLDPPQRPADFRPAPSPPAPCNGRCLTDWAQAPVKASYLAFGYGGVQSGRLVVFGWLYNVAVPDLAGAQVFNKFYVGSLDETGARKVAREFAADILGQFGLKSLSGTSIYYVHERGAGNVKDIWAMDYDGSNPRRITSLNNISFTPSVSSDGAKLAFTTYAKGTPQVMIMNTETRRFLPFVNPVSSLNATPSFSPGGGQVVFSTRLGGSHANLYIANADGSNLRPLSSARAIEVEPKVNPKTGAEIVFTSGRGGRPQVYRMSVDGTNIERLSSGEGEAVNPAWHPEGKHIVFAWTRGFAPGNRNIFLMDVATREVVQLTHGAGRNENPTWAPDGRHIVFASSRAGSMQVFSMLVDGTQVKRLTSEGINTMPVWSSK
jgi:TolB protein